MSVNFSGGFERVSRAGQSVSKRGQVNSSKETARDVICASLIGSQHLHQALWPVEEKSVQVCDTVECCLRLSPGFCLVWVCACMDGEAVSITSGTEAMDCSVPFVIFHSPPSPLSILRHSCASWPDWLPACPLIDVTVKAVASLTPSSLQIGMSTCVLSSALAACLLLTV